MTEAELSALPALHVADGTLLCTAIGADGCPLRSAVANPLGKGRIALWEPGRLILLLDAGSPQGRTMGEYGDGEGKYIYATAVGEYDGGVAVLDAQRNRMLQYRMDGTFKREDPIPPPSPNTAPGFVGALPVRQSVRAVNDTGVARLRLEILPSQRDSAGRVVFDVPVPWLRYADGVAAHPSPLFPVMPRYAVDPADRSIVWSPADTFLIERRRFDGSVSWTLSGDRRSAPITAEDVRLRREEVYRAAPAGSLPPGMLDSMVARNPASHPVIGGFLIDPTGRVLVASSAPPTADSVGYLLLTREGEPVNRFSLPSRTRPLYFAGDSILVHRPTEGEPWEVLWLRLRASP